MTTSKGEFQLECVGLLEIVCSEKVPEGITSQLSLKDKEPIIQEKGSKCSQTGGQQVQKPKETEYDLSHEKKNRSSLQLFVKCCRRITLLPSTAPLLG